MKIASVVAQFFACVSFAFYPISIPTRDAKTLSADLYATDTMTAKPVILIQTPYNKNYYRYTIGVPFIDPPIPYDSVHYNYVILDWRGFYGSAGAGVAGYDRGLDGYDAVEWISARRWCNGNVGTWGPSALGLIQFQTAKHRPPHLLCCVPLVADYKTQYSDYYYGGVYRKEHVEALDSLGFLETSTILAYPRYNMIWSFIENNSDYPESIAVPCLLISGWFDYYPDDVIRAFTDLRGRGAISSRDKHKLMIGPWTHGGVGDLEQGQLTYPNGLNVSDTTALSFFDRYLRGIANGYETLPNIRYYELGAERWLSGSSWSAECGLEDTLFFSEGFSLLESPSTMSAGFDTFSYNPRDPSPAYGGARFYNPFIAGSIPIGPYDQRDSVESRADVLVYSTPILTEPLIIRGYVKAILQISSNRLDTDFSARLCDVFPDGRSMVITQGIRRARFRNGYTTDQLLTPGNIYTVPVELQNISLAIMPGHRLRVIISSSCYPQFDINLNNGGAMYVEGETLIATNKIYRNNTNRSMLIFQKASSLAIEEDARDLQDRLEILAYPNPFNSSVRISIPNVETRHASSPAKIEIFDINGRRVQGFEVSRVQGEIFDINGLSVVERSRNNREFIWTPDENLGSGIYLIRATNDGKTIEKRVIYLK